MKLFVAIPAYDGKVTCETARALLDEQSAATLAGFELSIAFLPGCSLITHARNQLVRDFLATDADKLVFVDADVAWDVGSLLRLAKHPVDFVGGAYRYKSQDESYPVAWSEGAELWADPATGLLQVDSLPGGFLCLTRAVFERLAEARPDRAYSQYGHDYHGFFHAPIQDGKMYGEDAAFCADWRSIDGQVWLDPELHLTHVGGVNTYPGHIGNWLRNREAP